MGWVGHTNVLALATLFFPLAPVRPYEQVLTSFSELPLLTYKKG